MGTVRLTTGSKKTPIGLLPKNVSDDFANGVLAALSKLRLSQSLGEVDAFRVSYLESSFLSKYADETLTPAALRASNAVTKWLSIESRNAKSNFRISYDECTFTTKCADGVSTSFSSSEVMANARRIVADVIGIDPPEDLFPRWSELTNGASTRIKRGPVALTEKFSGKAHVSSEAVHVFEADYLEKCDGLHYLWLECGNTLELVDSSVMFTVPKSSEIDRVACKEPEVNMFLQRGIGCYFRDRLKRIARIDLRDQTPNQMYAYEGSTSRGRDLSTLDLSSASDSISESLVVELLPPAWFLLCNKVRVKSTILPDGTVHQLNMFSSMGNGFTFELESLLFYAIARAVSNLLRNPELVSVYGDDLIVGTDVAPFLQRVLAWFGFKLNSKKSFWKGKFRESCGAHWYSGHDVTPFYLRKSMSHQTELINQLNLLRGWLCYKGDNGLWSYVSDGLGGFRSDLVGVYTSFSKYVWNSVRGGRDIEDPSCLATPDKPGRRFTAAVRQVRGNQTGAYLYWLHRRGESDLTLSIAGRSGEFRITPNATWVGSLDIDLWLIPELLAYDGLGASQEPGSANAVMRPLTPESLR